LGGAHDTEYVKSICSRDRDSAYLEFDGDGGKNALVSAALSKGRAARDA
jgi:hypothetical protein